MAKVIFEFDYYEDQAEIKNVMEAGAWKYAANEFMNLVKKQEELLDEGQIRELFYECMQIYNLEWE